jgi:hypothetical protein
VATSAGDSVYYSAETSPVRDDAGLVPSYKSTAKTLDDDAFPFPDFLICANNGDEQALHHSRHVPTSVKAATIGRRSSIAPRLKVDIPALDPRSDDGDRSAASRASATGSSGTGSSVWSPASASSLSRIPRVAATNTPSSMTSPTLAAALKRSQIANPLMPEDTKAQQTQGRASCELYQPSTVPTASVRHVRTVNNLGATPILSRHPALNTAPSLSPESGGMDNDIASAQVIQAPVKQVLSPSGTMEPDVERELVVDEFDRLSLQGSSRASSLCTIKATPAVTDPVMIDSAIIYSKKSGASGTTFDRPFRAPSIIVMMAHNLDLGTFSKRNASQGTIREPSIHANTSTRDPSPVRGRAEQFVPTVRRQVDSEHSLQSSLGSDLRATAAEFVPGAPPSADSEVTDPSPTSPADSSVDLLGATAFDLDMYGIPWFYYMYQVQSAYNQGFQNGRARSPKKFRQKKQRASVSSPADAQQPQWPVAQPVSEQEQHWMSTMPPPASTVPLSEQRAQHKYDNSVKNIVASIESSHTDQPPAINHDRAYSPFAAQKALIAQQVPLRINTNVPRVDITSIRNVPMRQSPGYQNSMPNCNGGQFNGARRFYGRGDNGLYSYGSRGVPIQETVPFPTPMPPQGRPVGVSVVGSEACGNVQVLVAAERGGGPGCFECEPDHGHD